MKKIILGAFIFSFLFCFSCFHSVIAGNFVVPEEEGGYLKNFSGIVVKICLLEKPEGNRYVYIVADCGRLFCSEAIWKIERNLPRNVDVLNKEFNKDFPEFKNSIKLRLLKKYPEPCWNDKILEIYIEDKEKNKRR